MTTRRRFLRRAAAAAGLATLPGAALARDPGAPSAFPALDAHRRQARIARVDAFAIRRLVLVKVTADDGSVGWGEAGHSGGALVAEVVRRQMDTLVRGMDVFDGEGVWHRAYFETDELGPGGLASQALAGLDCALWDLRGRLLGAPVWALLGGKMRSEIPLYGSFSRSLGDGAFMTTAQAAARAEELVAEGFRAVKLRLGIREENVDPDPDPAVPFTRAVREAVGPDVPLYVDANNGYTARRAIEVGKRLAGEFGVEVFEEPVAAYQYPALARVAAEVPMQVAAGEHEYTLWAFRDLIQHGRPDILNPDVSKMGGLTPARKTMALAETFDLPVSVHNARPTLLTAAHAHLIAGSRMAFRTQEHPGNRRLSELWEVFENRLGHENGVLRVPDAPGLGLTVDEAALARAADR